MLGDVILFIVSTARPTLIDQIKTATKNEKKTNKRGGERNSLQNDAKSVCTEVYCGEM